MATTLIAGALVVSVVNRASAMHALMHVTLVKSDPKLNDTLTASPKAIRLWFSESVQTGATSIRLSGADSKAIPVGKPSVASEPKSPVEVAVSETLKPGRYTVDWRTMASDGHPAKGTLSFVVR
ncbi:MAG TPA: copper resistance CopC family protein [Gemmatimonadaceae bacterium]